MTAQHTYSEPLPLARLRALRAEAVASRDPHQAQWVRQLDARIRAAEVAAEPGLHHLAAVAELEQQAAERGPQSCAWQALRLLDELRAQVAFRKYFGRDCRGGRVVVAPAGYQGGCER